MFLFGSGNVIAKPTLGSPMIFGTLQSIEIDVDTSIVELYGQNKFADAIAQGQQKITGKAKIGNFDINVMGGLYLDQTVSTGQTKIAISEAGTVPASSTYTITVTNSATFVSDYGVRYAATGLPLTLVASGPTIGQYSVAAGVYTFASADASAKMKLSYTYTATGGHSFTLAQTQMGTQNNFACVLQEIDPNTGKTFTLQLNKCIASKLSLPFANTSFAVQDFEFQAFADASGVAGIYSTDE